MAEHATTNPNHAAAGLPAQLHGRKATWFELFFDLVFVVAVAELSAAYAHHYDAGGAAVFAGAFIAMWWCWLGHTFHATRFDAERIDQRAIGLAQTLAVALIGYGAADPLGQRAWAFGGGIGAFKALLALAYLREWRWPGARPLIRTYAGLYAVQAALWLGGAALPPPARVVAWLAALALDLVSPWLVARHTTSVPPHPEHLPERFGLFTIILLGEGMAGVVHALGHGETLTANAIGVAAGGALVTFMLWTGYFQLAKGHGEREVAGRQGGRDLRLWAYAHVPIYLGVASLAAGTVALSTRSEPGAVPALLYAAGLALAMLGISLLGPAGRPDRDQAWRQARRHAAVAIGFVLLIAVWRPGATPVLVAAALVACGLQLLMARRR
jgi:low temperature requirement protein LtrA